MIRQIQCICSHIDLWVRIGVTHSNFKFKNKLSIYFHDTVIRTNVFQIIVLIISQDNEVRQISISYKNEGFQSLIKGISS